MQFFRRGLCALALCFSSGLVTFSSAEERYRIASPERISLDNCVAYGERAHPELAKRKEKVASIGAACHLLEEKVPKVFECDTTKTSAWENCISRAEEDVILKKCEVYIYEGKGEVGEKINGASVGLHSRNVGPSGKERLFVLLDGFQPLESCSFYFGGGNATLVSESGQTPQPSGKEVWDAFLRGENLLKLPEHGPAASDGTNKAPHGPGEVGHKNFSPAREGLYPILLNALLFGERLGTLQVLL
ncbi:hypothetical protein ERJ75_000021900 [Trypanosoma vivax]|nr:hypothetical protein TRVL_10284 [Trypanosoma vivax]KAH8611220.1 hypothetical protein ERJ75_001019800 [Trypanosoma vivax]KAH8620839.1 hypothetical protein ERJ75_000021900 [Trypanosoma vivax]